MQLAFFAQYGYSNPVLKMFQGGSSDVCSSDLSFSSERGCLSRFRTPEPKRGKPFPERLPSLPFPPAKRHTAHGAVAGGRAPRPNRPQRDIFSNGRAAPCPPLKTEKRPPQKPNGATAVRRSSAAASHGWRTDIPAHRHDCGTHSWLGARCHGRRRRVPAPCRRNRR